MLNSIQTVTQVQDPLDKATYSETEGTSSSECAVSSSDWSLRRSHGSKEAESAISRTGAMLVRRLSGPFSEGGASLAVFPVGLVFWKSIATVPR